MEVTEVKGDYSTGRISPVLDKELCLKTFENGFPLWLHNVDANLVYDNKTPENDTAVWIVVEYNGGRFALKNKATNRFLNHDGIFLRMNTEPEITNNSFFGFHISEDSSVMLAQGGVSNPGYWISPHLQFFVVSRKLPRLPSHTSALLELITKVHQYPEKEPSEIAEQDFQQYWAIANEQWKLLEALIEEYLKVIEDSQGNQDKDPLKKELCHAIGKLADIYYPVQRFLFENSNYTPDQLRPYEVFLSHTGKQKFSYVDTIFNQFQPYPTKVFFDIKTLYAGDPAKEQMKYAALNCNVAIVVLSKDFLKKKWPLLELSLFAARLRKKTLLSQSPKNLIFSTEEKLDLEFSLLFDFYDQEEKAAWADRVLSIPDFLVADFPTGIVHWEPLDSVNAQRVVNITLQRLKIEHPAGSLL